MIRYQSVVLICSDIRASVAFYQDLFNLTIDLDIGALVNFKEGIALWDQKVASDLMYQGAPPSPVSERPNQEIYFETDDIDAFSLKIHERSVRYLHQIEKTPWSQRTIRFFDPDGNLIEVGESMEDIIRRFGREGKLPDAIAELTMMPSDIIASILKTSP